MNYIKIVNGVIANNTYLIVQNQKCLIVDPSFGFQKIEEVIKKNYLTPVGILITHPHHDHIASVDYFCTKYKIDVYVYDKAKDMLRDPVQNLSVDSNLASELIVTTIPVTFTDELVVDEFTLTVFKNFGHTNVCVSYIYEDLMFTGDFIFKSTIGRTDFIHSDMKLMQKSLNKLKQVKTNYTILPGHGEITSLDVEKLNNTYLMDK